MQNGKWKNKNCAAKALTEAAAEMRAVQSAMRRSDGMNGLNSTFQITHSKLRSYVRKSSGYVRTSAALMKANRAQEQIMLEPP